MQVIKLNAIPSTNDFLKELIQTGNAENFCCVVAENQTKGRGQMGASWSVEEGKNLTFSLYIENIIADIAEIYLLNVAVAVSIFRTLERNNISKIAIKWPNDIMADNKKLGGILIENSIKGDGSITSIVGIGLNVNQKSFENIPTASSMLINASKNFDKEVLLMDLLQEIETTIVSMKFNRAELWSIYKSNLFRKDVPTVFEIGDSGRFMGIVRDVSAQGLLIVEHEDESFHHYNIKEIKMLY